jgi:hypothetical protein
MWPERSCRTSAISWREGLAGDYLDRVVYEARHVWLTAAVVCLLMGCSASSGHQGNACTPVTCQSQGKTCGLIDDRCGDVVECGTCTLPETCGGGGVANVCGVAPVSDSYATAFPATENPISEGGAWVAGKASGIDWNDPETESGNGNS